MIESMVDYEPIADLLIEVFGEYKFHNDHSGQIAFSCPVCSFDIKSLDKLDGKGNLEVNYKMGVYKCWSCAETHGTHGVLYYLVKKYGSKRDLKNFITLMLFPIITYSAPSKNKFLFSHSITVITNN